MSTSVHPHPDNTHLGVATVRTATPALTVAALGVVFGDLGTSPLYALQEAFHGPGAVVATRENVLGVVSLFVWSLILVISVKYIAFIMRADNRGEGGVLALLALTGARHNGLWFRRATVGVGLFGATLLYGDGVITPAVSVLSAVEGLEVASTALRPAVIPATLGILVGLFCVQRYGSGRVGRLFGPVLALWFVVIAALGLRALIGRPEALAALNPAHAVRFFAAHGLAGVPVLGAVILCLTGGEALYADMGHFGARPIRVAWYGLVLPALVLNYLGQAAVLLGAPEAAARPFYAMVPGPLLYPMVALATLATIIASQALISAVFSLTRQAVQLGYWPRVHVVHTSASEEGQIYVPAFNWAVMAATLALVLAFRSSARLASAFGLAVAGTMAITTVLFAIVARRRFRWPAAAVGAFVAVFLTIDVVFFAANATKLLDGAWLPLAIGAGLFVLMTVWMRGRSRLRRRYHERAFPLDEFLTSFALGPCVRVPGAAVFLSPNAGATPPALLHYLKHAKSLHEQVVILTVQTEEVPHVTPGERVEVEALTQGFWRVVGRFGFMETPDVPVLLGAARARGLGVQGDVTYFLGRETVVASRAGQRGWWGARLFAAMHRNARPAADFFALPSNQIMEVGAQVDL